MYIKNSDISGIALDEIEGTVQGHRDGHGFVVRDDGEPDIYLPPNEMRAVLHRDRVKVRIVRQDRRGRPEGRVLEIAERPAHPIIGRLLHEGSIWLVAPEDKRYGQDVLIPKTAIGAAKQGQVVVVELTEPPALYGQPVGRVKEVLGEIDDPGMEIEIAVRKYGVPHEFSDAAMGEARALPDTVQPADKRGRVDLTDVPLCTIDGEDARDFDDAVYCEPAVVSGRGKKPNGWRLLVAIADVSHYVKTGSPIDIDAYDRATSVYFPRRVIPMLPEKLSNGLCSLNPDVERLCMVCDMMVSAKGEVLAYQFYPAVMFSHARFTYTEVAAILANTRGPEAARRKDRVQDLLNLNDVFRALLKSRQTRGAVDFDTTETQIVCDEAGRIERIVPRVRNDAHKLIEECMLAANVCSADFIQNSEHVGLYRVHEGPTPEKQDILRGYLKALGLGLSISETPHPREFQRIAEATKERPDAAQIHMMLLRSMSQAIYTPVNSGHFGLAYEAYTHFTSPIRQFAPAGANVECQQSSRVDVLVDLLADFVRQPGKLRQRQVVRPAVGFQHRLAGALDICPAGCPAGICLQGCGLDNQGMLHCLSGQRYLQRRGQFDPLQPFLHEHLQCSHSCMNTSSSAAKASASRTSTVPTNRRTSSGVTRGKRPAMSLMAFGKKTLLQRAVSLFSFVSCVNDATGSAPTHTKLRSKI